MSTTGPKVPTAAQSVSESPWSDDAWVNPNNIFGAGEASVTAATFDAGDQTYVLKAHGFDFSAIPDNATIDGVQVVINARYAVVVVSLDLAQLLNISRAKVGTNKYSTPQALTTSAANYTVGGSADKWGNSLTPAWVKDLDFGVAIGCLAGGSGNSNNDVFIDSVTMEVWYTVPPTYNEAVTLAMSSGISNASASVIDAAVSLAMSAGQSQGEVADLLASLNLGMNAGIALASVATMSVALALQASMGQAHEGGASFDESTSLGASFDVSEDEGLDLSGDVSLGADFGESQEASGDLGEAVSFGSSFTLSPSAAADLVASFSLDMNTQITLGTAMILSAAISLNTVKGWSVEGSIAANTYEEAMSLGMVAAMTNALQLIIQSGVGFGISAGISESAQLDAAGNIGLGMGAGIAPESQLDAQSTVSFDAQFAKALSAAWTGDVSIALGMIASLVTEGEIPAAVTAARRLFQAIARKRAFKADPRGRDFKPVDRGRDFKGRKTN